MEFSLYDFERTNLQLLFPQDEYTRIIGPHNDEDLELNISYTATQAITAAFLDFAQPSGMAGLDYIKSGFGDGQFGFPTIYIYRIADGKT
ncbi:uncharacterized protein ColSpa_01551 [Colletotrichum spaethianum]|uniref:Uncharacterized protein n=1 Tax=Colletotrichum spaethianum TaxID=700344 RepID=A0AA37L746_9PEZI|nr:uncharacterized protein ColSpa_01551 [Colletotrichum spaethianum]GKT41370.1 hypothetical protein ColSpa_01551 [Colletotrichum spaethianum]